MNYWLHPEAEFDLREAAEYYRERAGTALAQAFFADFERPSPPGRFMSWRLPIKAAIRAIGENGSCSRSLELRRAEVIILLAGGDKSTQAKDIKAVLHLARNLSE